MNVDATIFVSYSRATADITGRIVDRLRLRFGYATVFHDVDSQTLGSDFLTSALDAVAHCHVVVAILGDDALEKLTRPDDYVRLELEAAKASNAAVIPVFVGKLATGMQTTSLPDSLAYLRRTHGLRLKSGTTFNHQMLQLEQGVAQALLADHLNGLGHTRTNVSSPSASRSSDSAVIVTVPYDVGAQSTIGRADRNDIVIVDPRVSASHALVRSAGKQLTVEDLGSSNGTFVKGQRLTPRVQTAFEDGESFFVGPVKVLCRFVSEFRLEGQAGAFPVSEHNELRVGRDPGVCAVFLTDPRVSAIHASLRASAGELFVRDEASNNGTFLDETRLPNGVWVKVERGSVLRFGPEVLRVVLSPHSASG